ncbi:hypothetical protein BaRGS_00029431 [Batillaria attramentaria]|uniref:Uncharacterized protein n=1 Tax=Batillaria attramentaria TaxID=370345 RepID=A0ABD0JXW7_9CAEN
MSIVVWKNGASATDLMSAVALSSEDSRCASVGPALGWPSKRKGAAHSSSISAMPTSTPTSTSSGPHSVLSDIILWLQCPAQLDGEQIRTVLDANKIRGTAARWRVLGGRQCGEEQGDKDPLERQSLDGG